MILVHYEDNKVFIKHELFFGNFCAKKAPTNPSFFPSLF
jgi:hypothetical protein